MAELLLAGRIRLEETKRSKLVDLVSDKPMNDPLIDECLNSIKNAKRRASLQTWVSRLTGVKKLKDRVAKGLCRRGVLRASEDKVLLIFTRKIYPEVDPKPEKELIEKLHEAVFTDTMDVDPRTVVLTSLASSTGLLRLVFDKKELKARKKRIEQLVNGEATGKAAQAAIEAMQAAIMVTVIIPAVVTTTVMNT